MGILRTIHAIGRAMGDCTAGGLTPRAAARGLRAGLCLLLIVGTAGRAEAEDVTVSTPYPPSRVVLEQLRTADETSFATHSGQVVIGTETPFSNQKLEIDSPAGVEGPILRLDGQPRNSNEYYGALSFTHRGTPVAEIRGYRDNDAGAASSGALVFFTRSGTADILREAMRVTSDGLVGIGTATPGAKLEIANVNVGGFNLRLQANTTTGTPEGTGILFDTRDRDWAIVATDQFTRIAREFTGDEKLIIYDLTARNPRTGRPGTPRLVIDTGSDARGRLGIGVLSPTEGVEIADRVDGDWSTVRMGGVTKQQWPLTANLVTPLVRQGGDYAMGRPNDWDFCALAYIEKRSSASTSGIGRCWIDRDLNLQWWLHVRASSSHTPTTCRAICTARW